MTDRVREILSWYDAETPGSVANLYRLLSTGRLAGTGKLVILPVDQGFEHGPGRSFAPNPAGYDPRYHAQLAVDAGCNGYAAPLGQLQMVAREFAGRLPLILKLNNSDSLYTGPDPVPAVTASVEDALRIGAAAVGFTIYPGSAGRNTMYEQIRAISADAKAAGLAVVVWSYPRGSGVSKEGETAVDVRRLRRADRGPARRAHHQGQAAGVPSSSRRRPARPWRSRALRSTPWPIASGTWSPGAFGGRRIVIFSGGAAKGTEAVLEENRQTALGGGFGTIMGRNSFQRPHDDAVELLHAVMDIHASTRPV